MSKLLEILKKVLPRDLPAEISLLAEDVHGLQMKGNILGLGFCQQKLWVRVRVEAGGRVGEAFTNFLSLPSLRQTLAQARENAALGKPGPLRLSTGKGLPEAPPLPPEPLWTHREMAASLTPIADLSGKANLVADALLTSLTGEYTLVNTAGLAISGTETWAQAELWVFSLKGPGSGYGYVCQSGGERPEVITAFLAAAAKCQATEKQQPLPPGEYTVILEPAAVADLMAITTKLYFSGRAYSEGLTPPFQLGEKVFDEKLSIWDAGLGGQANLPFDFEGMAKQRLNLVKRGVILATCLDHETAAGLDSQSTGHAPPPGCPEGPLPRHLRIGLGNAMLDDMITSTEKGILVSRLVNTAILDSRAAFLTGIAAGGALLVEEGRFTWGLPELRFLQNIGPALNSVDMIGDEALLFGGLWREFKVPALKLNRFTFLPGNPRQV